MALDSARSERTCRWLVLRTDRIVEVPFFAARNGIPRRVRGNRGVTARLELVDLLWRLIPFCVLPTHARAPVVYDPL